MAIMLTQGDLQFLKDKGIPLERVNRQLEYFQKGFPPVNLTGPATIGHGIIRLNKEEIDKYSNVYHLMCENRKVVKFVPASGAATRMFKDLFFFVEEFPKSMDTYNEFIAKNKLKSVTEVMDNLSRFAFYDELRRIYAQRGQWIEDKIARKEYIDIARTILMPEGLNYGFLPKGLLSFHIYMNNMRTPVEEHLVEGIEYARCNNFSEVNVHFTVSPEHRTLFEQLVAHIVPRLQDEHQVKINVEFSEQKPITDTIAVNPDGTPFHKENGEIMFRPGGHGALIENLNDLDADILFIKNIDNVVPDALKLPTLMFKKALAGMLMVLQHKAFEYLEAIDNAQGDEKLPEMESFIQNSLQLSLPDWYWVASLEDKLDYLYSKMDRPIRVCGMVKNEGEPGGGPFWVKNEDGSVSLQILESVQIDMKDPEKLRMFKESTHFNPVDLVCSVRDYKGDKYDLPEYVDHNMGFISSKTVNGKPIRALELPGLWNGSMSDWNTIFVEVPVETFNPVKTINDLLRRRPDFASSEEKYY